MMGQIDEWLFSSLAGIQPDEQEKGYQHLVIRPQAVGDLKNLTASYETLYGKVAVAWTHEDGLFTLKVTIPANCSANVYLPGDKEPQRIQSGSYTFNKNL